nr:MAG TPA: hypothetical protein [Caudoviricetes sp.]
MRKTTETVSLAQRTTKYSQQKANVYKGVNTMKNIEVTYDAMYPLQTGNYEQGEAAFILPMTDELAAEYLAGRATDRGAVNLVETALEAVEVMRGRVYVRGSIKAYYEAK